MKIIDNKFLNNKPNIKSYFIIIKKIINERSKTINGMFQYTNRIFRNINRMYIGINRKMHLLANKNKYK